MTDCDFNLVARFDHSEGVQALQLDPGIIRCEVPLSDGVGFVSLADPGVDLVDDCLFVGDAPVEALRGEDAEFGFGQVQPGTVFRRVMLFEALDEFARPRGREKLRRAMRRRGC